MNKWIYNNNILSQDQIDNHLGFVYIITNILTGKKYIGKKLLRSYRKKIIKGKSKRVLTESDWNKYYGSSQELKEDIKSLGIENFKREILMFCKTKSELSYKELKLQMEYDVVLRPKEFYNSFVGTRINGKHLSHLYIDDD